MFSVSRAQLRTLAERTIETYIERVTARICCDFPAELGTLPVEELRLRVKAALIRFRAHGFQRKEHLHRLIVLELLFGPQFETKLPQAVRLLAFPPPGVPCSSESERFWTVYRSADQLAREDVSSSSKGARSEKWR